MVYANGNPCSSLGQVLTIFFVLCTFDWSSFLIQTFSKIIIFTCDIWYVCNKGLSFSDNLSVPKSPKTPYINHYPSNHR
jgi:hypothetical protein